MKKIIKKSLVFGAGVILLTVALFSPLSVGKNIITVDNSIIEEKDESENKVFKVAVGPVGAQHSDECKVITNLSETEALNLKEQLLNIEGMENLSSDEIISKKFEILRKYNIFPPEFTFENITKILQGGCDEPKKPLPAPTFPRLIFDQPHVNVGPHFCLYCSVASQLFNLHIPRVYNFTIANISRVTDFLKIDDPSLKMLLSNISILYYLTFIPALITVGGSMGLYASVGFLSVSDSTFIFSGPYIGVYFPMLNAGIYIYSEIEDPRYPGGSVEKPFFDIIFGFSLFSIQLHVVGTESNLD